jgi:hypothetical protein
MFAIYDDPTTASRGVERLLDESFDARRIRVVFFDDDGPEELIVEHRTRHSVGAAAGAALGCLVGAMVTASGLVTPEVGVVGGTASGLAAGVFAGLSIWKKKVDLPVDEEHAGGVLLSVPAHSDARRDAALRAFETSDGRVLADATSEVTA